MNVDVITRDAQPMRLDCDRRTACIWLNFVQPVPSCDGFDFKRLYNYAKADEQKTQLRSIQCVPAHEGETCTREIRLVGRDWSCEHSEARVTLVYNVHCRFTGSRTPPGFGSEPPPTPRAFSEPTEETLTERKQNADVVYGIVRKRTTMKCPSTSYAEYRYNAPIAAGSCGVPKGVDYRGIEGDAEFEAEQDAATGCADPCADPVRELVYANWACDAVTSRASVELIYKITCK